MFEYIRMHKPILSFSTAGGVLTDILTETETGENFEYDDIEGIKKYLMNKYSQWKRHENVICGNKDVISKYSRRNLTYKLTDVFDKVLEQECNI